MLYYISTLSLTGTEAPACRVKTQAHKRIDVKGLPTLLPRASSSSGSESTLTTSHYERILGEVIFLSRNQARNEFIGTKPSIVYIKFTKVLIKHQPSFRVDEKLTHVQRAPTPLLSLPRFSI